LLIRAFLSEHGPQRAPISILNDVGGWLARGVRAGADPWQAVRSSSASWLAAGCGRSAMPMVGELRADPLGPTRGPRGLRRRRRRSGRPGCGTGAGRRGCRLRARAYPTHHGRKRSHRRPTRWWCPLRFWTRSPRALGVPDVETTTRCGPARCPVGWSVGAEVARRVARLIDTLRNCRSSSGAGGT